MAIYVHVTELCAAEAARHGQSSFVEAVKRQIEANQSSAGFETFLPTAFLKKGLGRSFRLIGYRVPVGEDDLILFLQVFARGSKEYDQFLRAWGTSTATVEAELQPYDAAQLQQIHAELSAVPPASPPPRPNDEERRWLYEVHRERTSTEELLVLETDAWVQKMRAPETRDFLAVYHHVVERPDLVASSSSGCQIHWEKDQRIGLVYLHRPDIKRLVLLEPLRKGDDAEAILAHHQERLSKVGVTAHELSRIAGRSYPYFMILEQEFWLAIQKDEEANLALSPEEAEILDSARKTDPKGGLGYPLFINGRAGSGKSTLLQYLAADYVEFALRQETALRPIYMTCSEDLLERAKDTVRGLLTAHHERLLHGAADPAKINEVLGATFAVFSKLLYSLLDSADRERFQPLRHVGYAEFRRLWSEDFAKRSEARHMSPDIAWHTIRSYIKGIRSSHDDELDPDEFAALPRRRRSVSRETYQQIYERVWLSWYKRLCEKEGYWDDQDLAATVLNSGAARAADFAAVFCDEAQDFTPIELEIIFQLSAFSKRSLFPEELRRVPLVFAGDPLQTINPTGFRWDAVQADFHDRFCAVLDPRRKAKLEVSYRELRFNYRSNPGIVRFCNLIQLVRAALLGSREVKPQEAWWIDKPTQTVWFAADDAVTQQQLQQRSDFVKVVCCEEGEESSYAQADQILSTLQESDGVFRNVLGPTRAKGLEFPAVVVYRFAEHAPPGFSELLAGELDIGGDPEKLLPFEYFFNRLYVAASRAKGRLVVVDSASAFEEFWRFATDPDVAERLTGGARDPSAWKDALEFLVRGGEESWAGKRVDPLVQAGEYTRQGERNRDPYLMRQAAAWYRSANKDIDAGRCRARADRFDRKLLEAGDQYRRLGALEDAFECYWEAGKLDKIRELATADPKLGGRLESRAADFVARNQGVQKPFLVEVLKAANDPAWRSIAIRDPTWRDVLAKIADRLAKTPADATLPWHEAFHTFGRLRREGLSLQDRTYGSLAYAANEYGEAISAWERAGATDHDEYRRAKARHARFPENIVWFSRAREHREVLAQWRSNRASVPAIGTLDGATLLAVLDAALETDDLTVAAELLALKPDRSRIATFLASAVKRNDAAAMLAGPLIAVRFLVASGSWAAVVRVAENADFGELAKGMGGKLAEILRSGDGAGAVFRTAIEELASSQALADEVADLQKPIADLLHKSFIGKGSVAAKHGLSLEVVGAAIERAGRVADAKQYYEGLGRDSESTPELKRFAAERFIKTLEREVDESKIKGETIVAEERAKEVKSARDGYGLGDRALPNFPAVSTRPAMFKATFSGEHRKLRIEHTTLLESVSVHAKPPHLRGDAEFTEIAAEGDAVAAWQIPAWNATIKLVRAADALRVVAHMGSERFEQEL